MRWQGWAVVASTTMLLAPVVGAQESAQPAAKQSTPQSTQPTAQKSTQPTAQKSTQPAARESGLVIFDFEGSTQEWAIPDWARTSLDYVGKEVTASQDFASHGKGAMQVMAEFPGGGKWTAVYVEILMPVTDWSQFGSMAADIHIPYNVPAGLQARLILTVGEDWKWTEMNRAVKLKSDQWTTMTADLKPGSLDWKFFPTEAFRKDVRKVGIRIESDKEPAYRGPIFIDHIRLLE